MEIKQIHEINYAAQIVRLPAPYKHPNADRLQCVNIMHNIVITGLNAKEGDLYVYFPLECQISKFYLKFTNSYSDANQNTDTTIKGFFDKKGRVRAVKLRGQPSMGYIVPLSDFITWLEEMIPEENLHPEQLTEGLVFDTIEGYTICKKYIPEIQQKGPARTEKQPKKVRHNRIIENQFRFHVDTLQLKRNLHMLNPDDIITISEKLHGTSLVCSNLLVKRKLNWYEKLATKIGLKIKDTEYGIVYSSRNVIKNQYLEKKELNHWYKEDIWGEASKVLGSALQDGISIYAEVVGFTSKGNCIQKGYDYGCKQGQFEIYVYRMTSTNQSGDVIEFTTGQMLNYCNKYNLKTVPIHYHGRLKDYHKELLDATNDQIREQFINQLTTTYLESNCRMCNNKVPAEGVVVTVEKDQFEAYKLKSFAFFEQETKALDKDEVDLETSGSE